MPAEPSQPSEALSISDILNALEIDCGAVPEEPDLYVVVPGNSGPRWLVPAVSRGTASVFSARRPDPGARLPQIDRIPARCRASYCGSTQSRTDPGGQIERCPRS